MGARKCLQNHMHVATCAEVWAMLTNPELELEVEEEAPEDIEGSGASLMMMMTVMMVICFIEWSGHFDAQYV